MTELLTKEQYNNILENIRMPKCAFLDGKFIPSQSKQTFDSINPVNDEVIAKISACDSSDVDLAVRYARRTFNSGVWAKMPLEERKEIMIRWAKLMKKHIQELATLEAYESGKPINDCINVDLPETINTIIWYAESIDKVFDKIAPTGNDAIAMIVKEPVGVVGAILPWNFPLLMLAWKVGPALATGNSIIVKPSENTSMSTLRIAELASEAGLPDGVLQIVTGSGKEVGKAIGEHMDIDMVTFTGSTNVGKEFLKYSANSNLKEVVLELGGKNPFVVLDDANQITEIAEHAVNAGFWNMGENCSAGSRIIVHKKHADELTEKIIQRVKKLSIGEPLDGKNNHGPLVSKSQMNNVLSAIKTAKEQGATLSCGGEQIGDKGNFVSPAVFTNVSPDMDIFQNEVFGPVISITIANSNEEALDLANDTKYGLSASVFTQIL